MSEGTPQPLGTRIQAGNTVNFTSRRQPIEARSSGSLGNAERLFGCFFVAWVFAGGCISEWGFYFLNAGAFLGWWF